MAHHVLTDLDFNSVSKITNLPSGVADGDAATMAQLRAAIEGISWKTSVKVATTTNIDLSSPGATLNGVTLTNGDRVLVKDQTNAAQNGIYVWSGSAVTLTRALDANTATELEQAVVSVEAGTLAGTSFRQTQANFTLDSGDIIWAPLSSSTASATEVTQGVAEIATQAETDTGTDDTRFITPAKLAAWAGRSRKVSQNIGDGTATSYTVTHNFNTRDVQVTVRRNSGAYDQVLVDWGATTVNSITVTFSAAQAVDAFRVTIQA